MKISARLLKWLLRFYPPLLFQRIWVIDLDKDFRFVKVKICSSLLNRNYNRSIFGGTIYAAADPFYPVLLHRLLTHEGFKIIVWLKSASISFIKPGSTNLYYQIAVTDDDLNNIRQSLLNDGKIIKCFPTEIYSSTGELCASVICEVYIRNLGN